jgi:lactate dehydrogenase-like 2-hydroxyacid dehydrogenase
MKKIILIPDRLKDNIEVEENIFGKDYQVVTQNKNDSKLIPDDLWQSADAILAWHEINYDVELISKLNNCKVIVRIGVGVDNVDLDSAKKKGIMVCNIPDYGTNDVADHAMALLLGFSRGTIAYDKEIRLNRSWEWDSIPILNRLSGSKIGIIGLGRIGMALSIRAKIFGMKVLFYDPYVSHGIDKIFGYKRCMKLFEMIKLCDYISIHTPLTKETYRMVNDDFFSNIKKGAIVINTARGEIVSTDSLYKAIKDNVIKAAGLDVLEYEPPDYKHPLIEAWSKQEEWIRNRLIVTPHAAFYNSESYIEMRQKAAFEAKRVLEGESPYNRVI